MVLINNYKLNILIVSVSLVTIVFAAGRSRQTASMVEPPRSVDKSFSYVIKKPAYPEGKGPVVLIDEAHNNFHTAVGTYLPFADLLKQDGYVIRRAKDKISEELLASGTIYVIADAQPPFKVGDPPTFDEEEIQTLNEWVKNGGALFVITDHMPDPGAIEDLALSFGIEVSNGYVMEGPPPGSPGPMLFQKKMDLWQTISLQKDATQRNRCTVSPLLPVRRFDVMWDFNLS